MLQANFTPISINSKEIQGRGLSFLDVIQKKATLGVMRGIEKFDYKKGYINLVHMRPGGLDKT